MATEFLSNILDRLRRKEKSSPTMDHLPSIAAAEKLIDKGRHAESAGRLEDARDFFIRASERAPDYSSAHLNLGIVLAQLGETEGAKHAYEKVLQIDKENPFGYYNLANLYYQNGDLLRAERLLQDSLYYMPKFPEARVALANVLEALGRHADALIELNLALDANPDYVGALYNFGLFANHLRRYEDAEDALNRLLDIDPNNLEAMQALAISIWGQGRCAEAAERFQALRDKVPWVLDLQTKELFLLNYDSRISPADVFIRHRSFGEHLERAVPRRFETFGSIDSERPLRIAYLSPDFNWHPIALFIIPVIQHHNRDQCEVICYYTGSTVDEVTRKLQTLADRWIDASSMSDTLLADKIHEDGIDILVDLAGHTAGSRLGVFAQQPAPVQVAWMGYLNTTGLTRIQYRLCDARTDPLGISDPLHTEKLVRLPHSQWCYRPFFSLETTETVPVIRRGHLTFGSFNHPLKISPDLCAKWAEILALVPGSQLLCVGVMSARKMAELLSELTMTGVDPERIQIVTRTELHQYFDLYNDVDIALDTYPYGGGTTTFDALWMGVPVVAAKGPTPTSRSAASILAALDLDDWIAPSIDDYVRVAVERARDTAELGNLRGNLRQRLQSSPLMDEVTFIRDLEDAYRQMWRNWCGEAVNPNPDAEQPQHT
jgi:predicted O-linked N-acetylglucosamine transferase (SPINDLY family)